MKHLLTIAALIFALCACTEDPGAEATMAYYISCDSITYKDSLNMPYDSLVQEALGFKGLRKTGVECYFTESASVSQSSVLMAQSACNQQAMVHWKEKMADITTSQLADLIYKNHSSMLNAQGITCGDSMKLNQMTLHCTLFIVGNAFQEYPLDASTFVVE